MPRHPASGTSRSLTDDLCQVRCVHPEAVAQARSRLAPEVIYHGVAQLFGALADPTRAMIVHALLRQELCTCDLAAVAGITESGISQHLRVLRALHLVRARRAGKFVYYRLDDAHVALLLQLGLTHQGHADGDGDGDGDGDDAADPAETNHLAPVDASPDERGA